MTRKPCTGGSGRLFWFKSSYSDSSNPSDCVEVALEWTKSSYSDSSDINDCVEIATTPTTVHIRDSKNAEGPQLAFASRAWRDFVAHASGG
ncbi:DUF397 domain-containing protein [Streptomyces longispororuber]|uniref:DUF397 domain-containing protein n=1 Tax=Streptomyces longispororuber TaxID=68230 RepID=UPI0034010E3C